MLAGLLGHLGAGQVTLRNGVISGRSAGSASFSRRWLSLQLSGRDRRLLLIDAGNWLIALLVMGAWSAPSACEGVEGLHGREPMRIASHSPPRSR